MRRQQPKRPIIGPNFVLAATNLTAIPSILLSFVQGEYICSLSLLLAMVTSVAYHLIETKKHDMPGAFREYRSWKYHFYFINADRIGVITTICIHIPHIIQYGDSGIIIWCLAALIILGFSESLEFLRQRKKKDFEYFDLESQTRLIYEMGLKRAYILSHGTWHIMAFIIAFNLHERQSSLRHV